MKILLDECVTKKLKQHLSEFQVSTVVEMQWSGLKNGKLLSASVDAGFDILLTIDKNIGYQQNVHDHDIAIVIFDTRRSKIEVLLDFVPLFKAGISKFEKRRAHLLEMIATESDLEH